MSATADLLSTGCLTFPYFLRQLSQPGGIGILFLISYVVSGSPSWSGASCSFPWNGPKLDARNLVSNPSPTTINCATWGTPVSGLPSRDRLLLLLDCKWHPLSDTPLPVSRHSRCSINICRLRWKKSFCPVGVKRAAGRGKAKIGLGGRGGGTGWGETGGGVREFGKFRLAGERHPAMAEGRWEDIPIRGRGKTKRRWRGA